MVNFIIILVCLFWGFRPTWECFTYMYKQQQNGTEDSLISICVSLQTGIIMFRAVLCDEYIYTCLVCFYKHQKSGDGIKPVI